MIPLFKSLGWTWGDAIQQKEHVENIGQNQTYYETSLLNVLECWGVYSHQTPAVCRSESAVQAWPSEACPEPWSSSHPQLWARRIENGSRWIMKKLNSYIVHWDFCSTQAILANMTEISQILIFLLFPELIDIPLFNPGEVEGHGAVSIRLLIHVPRKSSDECRHVISLETEREVKRKHMKLLNTWRVCFQNKITLFKIVQKLCFYWAFQLI